MGYRAFRNDLGQGDFKRGSASDGSLCSLHTMLTYLSVKPSLTASCWLEPLLL